MARACAIVLAIALTGAAPAQSPLQSQTRQESTRPPDFAAMRRQQLETDRAWRAASAGHMQMDKITYRSRAGDLDVPAFVFQPLAVGDRRSHAAIVWVHENIRGHLYEHYIPYVREAISRGYVVIAPEYRGSIGYGRAHYEAIDYGGAEVDDVVTAASVLAARYPHVDPSRIGIMGWSHGGMIALLAVFQSQTPFRAAVARVPVTNLFHRLAVRGIQRQRELIDPHNRIGGSPAEKPDEYRRRSPLFHVDKLQIPLLVHLAGNDRDVTLDEALPLVDALRARKPGLSETRVFAEPVGGHLFDRRMNAGTWIPENNPDQLESWMLVWQFLERHLQPQ
jgi:dipeptidyl aminopeptidase/acylaminoacyl peptidase